MPMDWLTDLFADLQQWLFEAAVQPLVYALGLGGWVEDAFDATGWLLVGLIQIAVLLAVIGPLQRWRPVEPVIDRARHPHRHPLHADPPAGPVPRWRMFFALDPLFDELLGAAARRPAGAPSTSTSSGPA